MYIHVHHCTFSIPSSAEMEALKRHRHTTLGSESVDYGGEVKGQDVEAELAAAEVKRLETKVSLLV